MQSACMPGNLIAPSILLYKTIQERGESLLKLNYS